MRRSEVWRTNHSGKWIFVEKEKDERERKGDLLLEKDKWKRKHGKERRTRFEA